MKIAVIGATGYVGQAVVKELAARGHQVGAFARNTAKVLQADNVNAIAADVNAADFAARLQGFDAVVSAFNPGWKIRISVRISPKAPLPLLKRPKPPPCLIC